MTTFKLSLQIPDDNIEYIECDGECSPRPSHSSLRNSNQSSPESTFSLRKPSNIMDDELDSKQSPLGSSRLPPLQKSSKVTHDGLVKQQSRGFKLCPLQLPSNIVHPESNNKLLSWNSSLFSLRSLSSTIHPEFDSEQIPPLMSTCPLQTPIDEVILPRTL